MKIRRYVSVLALCAAAAVASTDQSTAPSQDSVLHEAQLAAQQLTDAGKMLKEADSAQNRVRALTETVRAYESGLSVLRTGLRQAALREAALEDALQDRETEIARLLGTLSAIERSGAPSLFLHPAGALGTARSGMILSDVTPALEGKASDLRADLNEIRDLAALQREASDQFLTGLKGVEKARAALSQAIANRTELPRRFIEDPVKTALLIAASETMSEFAGSLDVIATSQVPGSLPDIADRRGTLSLPVTGATRERISEAERPAIRLATPHRALVTTPVPATLRYRGPLLDYGNVVIVEPQSGILIVMAGLGTVFGEIGTVLPGGSPVGLMPGPKDTDTAASDKLLTSDDTATGAHRAQSLYIEVRENNVPVDPLTWFAVTEG